MGLAPLPGVTRHGHGWCAVRGLVTLTTQGHTIGPSNGEGRSRGRSSETSPAVPLHTRGTERGRCLVLDTMSQPSSPEGRASQQERRRTLCLGTSYSGRSLSQLRRRRPVT